MEPNKDEDWVWVDEVWTPEQVARIEDTFRKIALSKGFTLENAHKCFGGVSVPSRGHIIFDPPPSLDSPPD